MSKSKHTTGPWDVWHDGCDVWHIQATDSGGEPGDLMTLCDAIIGEANARLIALSPALYDFARDLRDNYDCDSDAHRHGTSCRTCEAARLLASIGDTP